MRLVFCTITLLITFKVFAQEDNDDDSVAREEVKKARELKHKNNFNLHFDEPWKYKIGDDTSWADPIYDDSDWKNINPELNKSDFFIRIQMTSGKGILRISEYGKNMEPIELIGISLNEHD